MRYSRQNAPDVGSVGQVGKTREVTFSHTTRSGAQNAGGCFVLSRCVDHAMRRLRTPQPKPEIKDGSLSRIRSISMGTGERDSEKEEIINTKSENKEAEAIRQMVAKHYRVSLEEMDGKSTNGKPALARGVAVYIVDYRLDLSPEEVSDLFGGRTRKYAKSAMKTINAKIRRSHTLKAEVEDLILESY